MPLVIKKRVSLDFLGEDYKDSFIIIRAMSMSEYDDLQGKDKDKTVREVVTEHFISGQIQQNDKSVDITLDNINELSPDIFAKLWDILTGTPDPKPEGQ